MNKVPDSGSEERNENIWLRVPVPLAWLAERDASPTSGGLADAFGDCYLCRNNPVYANLRRASLDYGYVFTSEDNNLWRDYQAMSLVTLQRILATKTIPYLDTSATVRRLLASNPAVSLPLGLIVSNIRHNYSFHESAHCVAHSALAELRSNQNGSSDRERFVEEAILGEAFANSIEMLGSLVQERPLYDTLFYGLNSYILPKTKNIEALTCANNEFGSQNRFSLLFLSFFAANLWTAGPADWGAHERILAAWGLPNKTSAVESIVKVGFRLQKGFRASTTPAWFEMLGYRKEYELLAKGCWLERPQNLDFLSRVIRRFWDLSGNP